MALPHSVRVKTSEGWQDLALTGPQGPVGPMGPSGASILPAGLILPFAGTPAQKPAGTLMCDGSEQLTVDYPILSALLGVTWGSASAGKFRLPDLGGRSLYGVGGAVALAATDAIALASRQGPKHHHTVGNHQHSVGIVTDAQGYHGHNVTVNAVGNHTHDGVPLGISYALATGATMANPGTGTGRYIVTNWRNTVADDGGHSHGASTDGQGSHQHNVNGNTGSAGAGASSGGGKQDEPSWAGVNYVITTGQ